MKRVVADGGDLTDLGAELGYRAATPMLIECSNDKDVLVRRAATLLLSVDTSSKPVQRMQLRLLDDSDDKVRYYALRGLARQRFAAVASVPKLLTIAANKSDALAMDAENALWSIDPQAAVKHESWQEFRSDEFQFSAQFPGKPQILEKVVDGLHGPQAWQVFQVECDPEIFLIMVGEIAPEVLRETAAGDEWYESMDELFAKQSGGRIVSSQSINLDGNRGHERICRVDGLKGGLTMVLADHQFNVGSRAYDATVVYPADDVSFNPIAVEWFFNSIRLRSDKSAD